MSNKEEMEMEYVSVYVPDMPRIIEFVRQAKGPDRTMAQFAEALSSEENVSVSASTLSRIVNNNKAKPLSVELIKAMVNKAANPDDISFSDFMRANGMMPKQQIEEREKWRSASTDQITKYENERRDIRNIISEELNARGYMMMVLPRITGDDNISSSLLLGRYKSNFVVRVHGTKPKYWGFHIYTDPYGEDEREFRNKRLEADLSVEMRNWARIFLTDLWESELFSDNKIKNTFLFTERDMFELFCDKLQNVTVNTNMSVMLMDLKKREIVSEVIFKRRDGKVIESLLDREKVEFNSFDEEDVNFY